MAGVLLSAENAMAGNMSLIEPSVLNGELAKYVFLDARPKSEWQAGHIPGALSFSWENFTRTDEKGVPFRVLPPQEMAAALGAMGIDEKTPLVIYGDADKSWGGEGWAGWTFAWLGHTGSIRILNGGIQAWRNGGLAVIDAAPKNREKATYNFKLAPQWDISTAEIEQRKTPMVLIDTRSMMEWLLGKIPGAIHIEWTNFYTGADRRPLDPAAFRQLLKDHGVDTGKPIVYYCRGGIRSGYAWMVHQLAGLPDARNYEGGMEAWWKLSSK
jgi:thiosulfate/3-mercaptopyruvate sulfurtransferase